MSAFDALPGTMLIRPVRSEVPPLLGFAGRDALSRSAPVPLSLRRCRVRTPARTLAPRDDRRRVRRAHRALSVVMAARAAPRSSDLQRLLARHRERVTSRHRVKSDDGLVRMVDALGFCFAFTAEESYPVPGAFDHLDTRSDGRKWEWMWGWKDKLAEEKRLYYGKLLIRKTTFV